MPTDTDLATAQTTYDTLVDDTTWTPAKAQAQLVAANRLAGLYRNLSEHTTAPLAVTARHAAIGIEREAEELGRLINEDFTDEEWG